MADLAVVGCRRVRHTKCLSRTCPTSRGTRALTCSSNTPPFKGCTKCTWACSGWVPGHALCSSFACYRSVGRLDDVLVHSSGEKTVPAPMETLIGSSPFLSGVCMFGRGRSQTGVLVEPRPEHAIDVTDDKRVAEFRNMIWWVAWLSVCSRGRSS
jgi:hypothetical protein